MRKSRGVLRFPRMRVHEGNTLMSEPLFERSYRDHKSWFTAQAHDRYRIVVRFHGRGTIEGTKAFLAVMDESIAEFPEELPKSALLDVSDFRKTPLRSQILMGHWLLTKKHLVGHVALVGARAWERAIAKAVMKLARMNRIDFFKTEIAALQWLDGRQAGDR